MMDRDDRGGGPEHRFGGRWTEEKLRVVAEYLSAYTTALRKQSFTTGYIDAFAGTGYRTARESAVESNLEEQPLLFPDLAEQDAQRVLEGSARLALRTVPRFDKYIFIEKDPQRCAELERLREQFPELADDIIVRQQDANEAIKQLALANWSKHRAVLFLDPYGMAVEWSTIEAVARTKAIDLWLLFPLGIGLNRLLPERGNVPESWRERINAFLGSDDWFDAFYETRHVKTLYDEDRTEIVKRSVEVIGGYFLERLKSVFPAVAGRPGVLRNSRRCPLYLLCFAVSSDNRRAQGIAMNIANHLLEGLERWADQQ